MKRLVIDVNSTVTYIVSGRPNGIGRTTIGLLNSLLKIRELLPFEIILFSQNMKGVGSLNFGGSFHTRHLFLPYRKWITRAMGILPVRETLMSYDLIHFPHNHDFVYNPGKTILTLHDAIFMHMNENAFDHLELRKKVPVLANKCRGIITCSSATKNDIINTMNIDPAKIDVIHWGIDTGIFHFISDRTEVKRCLSQKYAIHRPYFISVSCSLERKNTHLLIDAYLMLQDQEPENDLVLVWNTPPKQITDKIASSGYGHRIHILKGVQDLTLSYLYNGATALIFPSSYEGFGLPVLESMACGTPVVTCNNSSLAEVGGEAALYMNEPSVENILFYLEAFENKGIDTISLAQKGVSHAGNYNWDSTARQYVDVYCKYLGINQ
jgi:glycosyltransferase involved in cell wall biosynthesis